MLAQGGRGMQDEDVALIAAGLLAFLAVALALIFLGTSFRELAVYFRW
jgi:hypothetical protein